MTATTPARKMAPKPLITLVRETDLSPAARTRRPALPSRLARLVLAAALALCASAAARADDDAAACLWRPPAPERLAHADAVADYRSTLQACHASDGRQAVAIRAMSVGGEPLLLLADPDKLTTRIERAACWTCADADEASLDVDPDDAGDRGIRGRRPASSIAVSCATPASSTATRPAPSSPATSVRA